MEKFAVSSQRRSTHVRSLTTALALLGLGVAAERPAAATTYTCPGVKCSGANNTPVLTATHGYRIAPEIVLIFWGSAWGTTQSPSASEFFASALSLVNSPYFSALNQGSFVGYNGGYIAPARVAPTAPVYTGKAPGTNDTPASFTTADINAIVTYLIGKNLVPAPTHDNDMIYAVFTPTGSSHQGGFQGQNKMAHYTDSWQTPYIYEWIIPDSSLLDLNSGTNIFGHETVEAITQLEGVSISPTCQNAGSGDQIGDPCQCYSEYYNGFAHQGYWSPADGACVLPETWGPLAEYDYMTSNTLQYGLFNPRQIYSGKGGIVATDLVNGMYFYGAQASGTYWTKICSGCSAAAVGNDLVATVSTDTNQGVSTWSRLTGASASLGVPSTSVTGVYVTGEDQVIATDTNGKGWYFSTSAQKWISLVPLAIDQIVPATDGILALNMSHQGIDWLQHVFRVMGLRAAVSESCRQSYHRQQFDERMGRHEPRCVHAIPVSGRRDVARYGRPQSEL
jgi:hypothetical protein